VPGARRSRNSLTRRRKSNPAAILRQHGSEEDQMDLSTWSRENVQKLVEDLMAENSRLEEELATALAAWRAEVIRNASKKA
jgi:flagellar biosynthesis regulator FlaF